MSKVNKDLYAAIALALHEYMGNNVHDKESGKITIVNHQTQWNDRVLMMTKNPIA